MNIFMILLLIMCLGSMLMSILVLMRTKGNEERIGTYFKAYGDAIAKSQMSMSEHQDLRLKELNDSLTRELIHHIKRSWPVGSTCIVAQVEVIILG